MYSTFNEGKYVVSDTFIKTFNCKIYLKMAVNNSKFYLWYLNKLVHNFKFNNTYQRSFWKKTLIILLWMKKLREILKLLNIELSL